MATREVVDTTDGFREFRLDGEVDPAFRRAGSGRALLDENMRRQRGLQARRPPRAAAKPPIFGSWTSERQPGDIALLEGRVRAASAGSSRWSVPISMTSRT